MSGPCSDAQERTVNSDDPIWFKANLTQEMQRLMSDRQVSVDDLSWWTRKALEVAIADDVMRCDAIAIFYRARNQALNPLPPIKISGSNTLKLLVLDYTVTSKKMQGLAPLIFAIPPTTNVKQFQRKYSILQVNLDNFDHLGSSRHPSSSPGRFLIFHKKKNKTKSRLNCALY